MAVFHYSRVSREDQTTENQQLAARQSDMKIDHWFADDGVSGAIKAMDRPQFAEMMKQVREGDTLVVSAADRIGRNTVDVISTVEKFQAMKVKVVILAYGSLDLTSDIGMVVLSLAATFAQLERSSLRTRTVAGLARTKDSGTRLGAPFKISPSQLCDMVNLSTSGINTNEIAAKYGLPRNTVARNLEKWGNDLAAYKEEYNKRKEQYKRNKENKVKNEAK